MEYWNDGKTEEPEVRDQNLGASDAEFWILVTGSWVLGAGCRIEVTKTKKRTEGMISRPSEISETKTFHRAGRGRSDTEGEISG